MNFVTASEASDLFVVERFDTQTYERRFLTYGPTDFATANTRADYYQREFGRDGRYRYSVQWA